MDSEELSSTVFNPELEDLRNNISGPPDVQIILVELIEKSSSIHASYLFTSFGAALRKKLCLLLSATKPSNLYSGWEDFGNQLSLAEPLLQCIKYNFNHEDPTSNVLLAYVQKDSATLANIIQAVYDIKRFDIITQVEEEFLEMCNNVLETKNFIYNSNKYLVPSTKPDCPFIFKDIVKMCKKFEDEDSKLKRIFEEIPKHSKFEHENLKRAVPSQKRNYAKTVMLSYSSDANDFVKALLPKLRMPRDKKRLGVLVLNEQMGKMNLNPEEFIFDCFSQVDYVIPIITSEYVKAVKSPHSGIDENLLQVDNKYVKYVYTLMNTHYLRNSCRNLKVRCLIPDEFLSIVHTSRLMDHPLLQIWFKFSDTDEIVVKLINGDI